jgi:Spy/CpxP family protein refolding chaperone
VRLHDILDKTQRGKLVDAIEARFGHHGDKMGKGPGHMMKWGKDLNLTDQQRAQIRNAVVARAVANKDAMRGQWREMRAEGKALLERFEQDTFTLDDGSLQMLGRARIEAGIDRVLGMAEIVLPILTPEQRNLAAAKIRTIPQPRW